MMMNRAPTLRPKRPKALLALPQGLEVSVEVALLAVVELSVDDMFARTKTLERPR